MLVEQLGAKGVVWIQQNTAKNTADCKGEIIQARKSDKGVLQPSHEDDYSFQCWCPLQRIGLKEIFSSAYSMILETCEDSYLIPSSAIRRRCVAWMILFLPSALHNWQMICRGRRSWDTNVTTFGVWMIHCNSVLLTLPFWSCGSHKNRYVRGVCHTIYSGPLVRTVLFAAGYLGIIQIWIFHWWLKPPAVWFSSIVFESTLKLIESH